MTIKSTNYYDFDAAILAAKTAFLGRSAIVHPAHWQSVNIAKKPEMATHEVHGFFMCVPCPTEDLDYYREQIKPNLPWADDHFDERVCGEPLNPAVQWAKWPYAHSANSFRDDHGQFNHNYMERYWPRFAGMTDKGELKDTVYDPNYRTTSVYGPHFGIRNEYGDLAGVVRALEKDPLTRQAYLPVWFPEDTGDTNTGRKPCSLGYHFIMRNNELHISYYLRSCDFLRHFRDDLYLTLRLNLWVLEQLRASGAGEWGKVKLGTFTCHIVSLHMFRNDWRQIFGEKK